MPLKQNGPKTINQCVKALAVVERNSLKSGYVIWSSSNFWPFIFSLQLVREPQRPSLESLHLAGESSVNTCFDIASALIVYASFSAVR
jgi:hypothetical protein